MTDLVPLLRASGTAALALASLLALPAAALPALARPFRRLPAPLGDLDWPRFALATLRASFLAVGASLAAVLLQQDRSAWLDGPFPVDLATWALLAALLHLHHTPRTRGPWTFRATLLACPLLLLLR